MSKHMFFMNIYPYIFSFDLILKTLKSRNFLRRTHKSYHQIEYTDDQLPAIMIPDLTCGRVKSDRLPN